MSVSTLSHRATAMLALSFTAFAGCLDSTGPDHEEPDISAVLVAAASGSVATGTTTRSETVQTGTLTLRAGVPNTLTVRVLGQDALDEPVVQEHHDEYEIRVSQGGSLVTTAPGTAYPFALSLTPAAAGTVTYQVQVYSVEHGHEEFSQPVVVTVVAQ